MFVESASVTREITKCESESERNRPQEAAASLLANLQLGHVGRSGRVSFFSI